MDIQIKKGLLDACVLSSLKSGDSYGFKIIKDLAGYIEISESTLYPILKRLETSKCITTYSTEHNGRIRKYYSITMLGIKKIEDFIEEWKEINKVYNFIKGASENE